MSQTGESIPTWSWRPTVTPQLRRNIILAAVGLGAAIAVSAGIAIATPGRFAVVITVLLAGIGVFWWLDHQRFRSTTVSLGTDGILHVVDGRQSQSIDLSIVDSVNVRQRTQSGMSITAATPKWTIELAGPGQTLVHPIAHAAGLFNPDAADVERLEADLVAHVEQRTGRRIDRAETIADDPGPPRASVTASGPAASTAAAPAAQEPSLSAPIGRFEWRPPISPNADRRRRWFRVGYVGVAVLVAVLGITSAWGDWVGVVLSAVTVPGLILLLCGGLDHALGRSRRFALVVDDGVLRVERAGAPKQIELRGATVGLDRSSSHVATSSGTMRTTSWILTVSAADGSVLRQQMPGFGTVTVEADYVALERELRRRT